MSTDPSATEQIAAEVLAEQRCRDIHGDAYTPPYCQSCRSWASHVAQQIAARLDDRNGCLVCDEWETQYNLAMGEVNRLRGLVAGAGALAERIKAEADVASRPGQMRRLYALADSLGHDCSTCADCIHDGSKCCGCYDDSCCVTTLLDQTRTEADR